MRVTAMTDLEEARHLISEYVGEYNTQRLHSALNYLTPADYLQGPDHIQQRLDERKSALTAAAEKRRAYWRDVQGTAPGHLQNQVSPSIGITNTVYQKVSF